MAHPTPYLELNAVLEDLVTSASAALGGAFVSACLQGSFAVGDFDRHSDVDFVIVVADDLNDGQVDALQAIHRRLYGLASAWAQHLEGSYFPTGGSATIRPMLDATVVSRPRQSDPGAISSL